MNGARAVVGSLSARFNQLLDHCFEFLNSLVLGGDFAAQLVDLCLSGTYRGRSVRFAHGFRSLSVGEQTRRYETDEKHEKRC